MKPEQSTDKHTPGPWKIEGARHHYLVYTLHHVEGSERNRWMAQISKCNYGTKEIPDSELEANAKLIAAAPEMLSALKAIAALKRHDANQGEQPNPRYLTLNVKAILIADIEAAIQAASPAHQKEEAHG